MDLHRSNVIASVPAADLPEGAGGGSYAARVAWEISSYEECTDVHALPAIFDYWSERYLRPLFSPFGFDSSNEMFANSLEKACASSSGAARFVSLGSGNGLMEVAIASQLRAKGYSRFAIECFDLNPSMLARGFAAAEKAGVTEHVLFQQGDLNNWNPQQEYDAILADQSLHHVLCLETLFDQIKEALKAEGSFLISDMIGRNGHRRWPEALTLVHEFWRKLPPSYRYNRSLQRYEEWYEDWDCSQEGFEGIRSQDILPLLLQRFQFHLFIGFGNIIDPFVDRAFGPNFDAAAPWDRGFIDAVHLRDQQCLLSGCIKPTHMIAAVGKKAAGPTRVYQSLTPESCVRAVEGADIGALTDKNDTAVPSADPYDKSTWSHSQHCELGLVRMFKERVRQISELERQLKERVRQISELEKHFEERTNWALQLDKEIKARDKEIAELQKYINDPPLRDALRWASVAYKRAKKVLQRADHA